MSPDLIIVVSVIVISVVEVIYTALCPLVVDDTYWEDKFSFVLVAIYDE